MGSIPRTAFSMMRSGDAALQHPGTSPASSRRGGRWCGACTACPRTCSGNHNTLRRVDNHHVRAMKPWTANTSRRCRRAKCGSSTSSVERRPSLKPAASITIQGLQELSVVLPARVVRAVEHVLAHLLGGGALGSSPPCRPSPRRAWTPGARHPLLCTRTPLKLADLAAPARGFVWGIEWNERSASSSVGRTAGRGETAAGTLSAKTSLSERERRRVRRRRVRCEASRRGRLSLNAPCEARIGSTHAAVCGMRRRKRASDVAGALAATRRRASRP